MNFLHEMPDILDDMRKLEDESVLFEERNKSCVTRNQLRHKGIRGTFPPDVHKLSELVVLETHVRRSEKTEQRRRGRQSSGVGAELVVLETHVRRRRRQSSRVGTELVVLETHQTDVGEDSAAASAKKKSSGGVGEEEQQRRRWY
ncbi:hypothetical protein IGI04_001952 [Brassica rapa subsp. trilocularis]|uniref:Uncharacterized protein n=1 Tax=Brassica rapa subsp. trilocularis TaxID=1813537 RepID=A0ABQ7NWC9_BRACM|nr:hypothetical protein IGI04_001952 [Brassica rapa subsp. trilocularis]